HRRRALARARLREIDADAAPASRNMGCAHAFRPQRADGRVADRVRGQPGDVVALEAELREADGHVRLAAAERGGQHRRLEEALEPRRAQAQHDFAEGDDTPRRAHAGRLAEATLATMRFALAVRTSSRSSSMARAS